VSYAHTKRDPLTDTPLPKETWHLLEHHLSNTANRAARNAASFQCASLGESLGYLHDYGKYSPDFQLRLEDPRHTADHKTAGALAAFEHYPFPYGLILAYAIYGHHGGLPDHISRNGQPGLDDVLRKNKHIVLNGTPPKYIPLEPDRIPPRADSLNAGMSRSLWIRMLYSALVDADYLDTEQFMQPSKSESRQAFPPLQKLHDCYKRKIDELLAKPIDSLIAKARREVLESCIRSASGPKGWYTLTAPTGTGKTYASLAFAMEHYRHHSDSVRRIIVALPFTSLIEQTTEVYRDVFREELGNVILEHHSNVAFDEDRDGEFDANRLASENWDAPLIVSTNVQLFESLFASKPSRARKLHRLAGSIIILDEAQSLPEDLLLPSLAALRCLCADYGVTVLQCTATQPALQSSWLDGYKPKEIIEQPSRLYTELKRVNVTPIGQKSNEELADLISCHLQALCIVNTRRQAQDLYRLLAKRSDKSEVYHLSALMCAAHRKLVLEAIKKQKLTNSRCYVIATTLVEAGVDIDFPVVYRELAGLEGIVQAAGRCNRERKLSAGKMFLFESADYSNRRRWYSQRADIARMLLRQFPAPLVLEAVQAYFQFFYRLGSSGKLDKYRILRNLNGAAENYSFQFKEIEELFRFIPQQTIPVVIPYDLTCRKTLHEAVNSLFPGSYQRRLQRYTVAVYPLEFEQLKREGVLGSLGNTFFYLQNRDGTVMGDLQEWYDEKTGLLLQPEEED
jgi:CRISPR-associated helicase Cas3/CRISPR-associated endonuclease Cas3-HD